MFFKFLYLKLIILILLNSCNGTSIKKEKLDKKNNCEIEANFPKKNKIHLKEDKKPEKELKTHTLPSYLIDIQSINSEIIVDLKYASTDNFMKQKLYFDIDKLYLQKDVAERLSKVQQYLKTLHPNLTLLVYDGVRPVSVQQKMWDALDTIPVADRTKFVSNPANGSIHNYGAAVDLTICDLEGKALDMGAGYDDIRLIAYPKHEAYFLSKGELSLEQIENRKLLRKVMASQGFINIPTEWWHFNACSRQEAKKKYEILK
jgi:zinc D-Ala-D-Ala dipeptidase